MRIEEYVRLQHSNDFFHSEDMYALFISKVNSAVENAKEIKFNTEIHSPITQQIPVQTINHMGYRVPVPGKVEYIDTLWGYKSIALLSNRYIIGHLMTEVDGRYLEYAALFRGNNEYIPLTPDNYVPEIFADITDTMMFWEKSSIDPTYNVEKEMDNLFNQLGMYIQNVPGALTNMIGHPTFGFKQS